MQPSKVILTSVFVAYNWLILSYNWLSALTYIETKLESRCIRNTISFWERVGIVEKCVWIANRLSLRFSNQMVEIAKKLWLNSLNIYFCKRGGEQRRKCYSKSPPKTLWTCDLKRPKNPWKLPFHSKFLHNFCIPNR